MSNMKLTVLARIMAKSGKEEEVLHEILALIAPTRAEAGCINYDLHRAQDDPALFFLYENWRSRQDLNEHLATPYLQAFLGKVPKLLAEPVDLSFWDIVG
ncbi:MAG: putative quinol monooxygenase [Desulfuromonadales bacterium]